MEKLALAAVQAVQRFRHYILLLKTIVISELQPYDLYFDETIARGQVFQMDCYPAGIRFGVREVQV